jgi:hypothetical protein
MALFIVCLRLFVCFHPEAMPYYFTINDGRLHRRDILHDVRLPCPRHGLSRRHVAPKYNRTAPKLSQTGLPLWPRYVFSFATSHFHVADIFH